MALFVAWVVGGVAQIALNWVMAEDYYTNYWIQSVFVPVNPTAEYYAWRRYYVAISYLPTFALGYAVVGVWAFRRRGCLAVLGAAIFTSCPFLTWLANGLGRL